jgi:hypothetical protein
MIAVRCNLRGQNDAILCSLYLGHEPNKPEIELSTLIKFKELEIEIEIEIESNFTEQYNNHIE